MTRYTPAEVFPPGEVLREELEARGWTQLDLGEILGRPPRVVNEIITGKRSITPETAKGLADAFGTSAQFWMNLESRWQLSRVREQDISVSRRAKLFSAAPIKEMVRRNWIPETSNIEVLESRVLEFMSMKSLEEAPDYLAHAARKSTAYGEATTPAQRAWLRRALQLARALVVSPFTPSSFEAGLDRLRDLRRNPEDVREISRVLAEMGVRFVVIEPLAGTRIDGACQWLDERSPVVAISLRYDRIDWFWFTLMHELGHVKARDGVNRDACLDVDLVGEGAAERRKARPKSEVAADEFAEDNLIPRTDLDNFVARVSPLYSREKILGFAARMGVHPGIVVGQLHHRTELNGGLSYTHFRPMLAKVRSIITRVALTDGWGCTTSIGENVHG
jgi:HTH-type transcriptional regulator/antitoxin HigA